MNQYLSDKLRIISFIAIVMVVFLHSYNVEVPFMHGAALKHLGYNFFIQHFISQGATRIAVPLFFAISGYLFFLNIQPSIDGFRVKIKRRIRTLAVPYIIWSIFGLLCFLVVQRLPHPKAYFPFSIFTYYSANEYFSTILIHPIAYQLWFIRDLMVLVVLSPFLYLFLKYLKGYGLLILSFLWFKNINVTILSNEALLFFAFGSFLSISQSNLPSKLLSPRIGWLLGTIWLAIITVETLCVANGLKGFNIQLIHKIGIMVGMVAVWSLFDVLLKHKNIKDLNLYGTATFSFFLYAFHEPVMTVLKKRAFILFGQSEFVSLSIYIIIPIIMVVAAVLFGTLLKHKAPTLYKTITGGR